MKYLLLLTIRVNVCCNISNEIRNGRHAKQHVHHDQIFDRNEFEIGKL